MTVTKVKIQKFWRTSSSLNVKNFTLRYIILELQKNEDRNKILKKDVGMGTSYPWRKK